MSRNKKYKQYPNGGDGMVFYHKSTGHPAKQISHTKKTWSNRRYTHSPNNLNNYEKDNEYSTEGCAVYITKATFINNIYTRGHPYNMKSCKKKKR